MGSYKVLYRKYRPQFFADVIDQPQVTVTLKNELKRGRIAHAYLFTGSHGTGKTTCSKILARAVNCLNPQDGDPCGECEFCRGLENGSILDVVEIDAASNNGVDSIRSLIEESNFTPATAKYRVYIIDEVHMLSVAAFNALLKTLEEPPPHVIFILATTEVHKLLPTILSRCQRFDFKRISPEAIADRLEYIAEKESAKIDRDAALLIARIADGAMRNAISLLDQCLGRDTHVTLETVNRTAGIAARDYLSSLAEAVAERNVSAALETVDTLHKQSKDMGRLCEEMAEYFRGLMLIKTMRDASDLVAVSDSEWNKMNDCADSMCLSAIIHGLSAFEDALNKMRYANQRTQLEMTFVRLCSPELDPSNEAILRRIEALERGVPRQPAVQPETAAREEPKQEPVKAPEPEVSPTPAEEPPLPSDAPVFDRAPAPEKPPEPKREEPKKPPVQKPAPTVDIEALSAEAQRFGDWPEILQIIRNSTKSVAMAFSGSSAYINGDFMLIDAPELAFELLKRPEQRERMRDAIRQITGRTYRLGPYRKPKEKEETVDALDILTQRAIESGIEISEDAPETLPEDSATDEFIPF